jgi:hypothetical protein
MKTIVRIFLLFTLCTTVVFAQTTKPVKKVSRWHLDKEIKIMAVTQGGAEIVDGISTWQFSHRKLYYPEADPITRFFIGKKPGSTSGVARMVGFGIAENVGSAYLSQWMRHSRHKVLRGISWGLQPSFAGVHLTAAIGNFRRNYSLCNPGEYYRGGECEDKR